MTSSSDVSTAQAFATSWNNLPAGSVYTRDQFEDWMQPLSQDDIEGKRVLELGCGNGSILVHLASWKPDTLKGVDLGDSVSSARSNLKLAGYPMFQVEQADLVEYRGEAADLTVCIGVLHHLRNPQSGFKSVIENTRPGGRFHCWVYGYEGNAVVRLIVEPLRKIFSRFPWWFTKYGVALPAVLPFFVYAKALRKIPKIAAKLPLGNYALWIGTRDLSFFHHVAFDQLVTPQTVYLRKEEIQEWLNTHPEIEPESTYIIQRNGNSWKFGGKRKA